VKNWDSTEKEFVVSATNFLILLYGPALEEALVKVEHPPRSTS
jgi:hypothetical protein